MALGLYAKSTFRYSACDAGYVENAGRCYKYVGTSLSYADAEAACVAESGHLASANAEGEDHFLMGLAK